MALENQKVVKGNISTYEDASDAFLIRRMKDLRSHIRNPHLSANEFFQSVIMQTAISAGAIGWSSWEGLRRFLHSLASHNDWVAARMAIGKDGRFSFMQNADKYAGTLKSVSLEIAHFICEPTEQRFHDLLESLIQKPAALGHIAALKDLTAFKRDLEGGLYDGLSVEQKGEKLLEVLNNIHIEIPQSHGGQYGPIWEKMASQATIIGAADANIKARNIADHAYDVLVAPIIEKGYSDNIKIINKFRNPLVAALVGGTAIVVGTRAYQNTKKQKMLDMESESSFIERLMSERTEKKEHAPDTNIQGGTHEDRLVKETQQAADKHDFRHFS